MHILLSKIIKLILIKINIIDNIFIYFKELLIYKYQEFIYVS